MLWGPAPAAAIRWDSDITWACATAAAARACVPWAVAACTAPFIRTTSRSCSCSCRLRPSSSLPPAAIVRCRSASTRWRAHL